MSNRLAAETSPYLRQHADNPVDWWPWSVEARAAACDADKPILLSIGYSACHWCHVMAHESFEDEAIARSMNEKFICIKVDREERPDLDKIYQLAHQALTRRGGGWPLTMFLSPEDLVPFYAGTYFPPTARHGMPPFAYVLQQVHGFWDQRRADVRAQNATLREFLDDYGKSDASAGALNNAPIRAALAQIEQSFDREYGGHLGAPKFPHCPELELLLDLEPVSPRQEIPKADEESALQVDNALVAETLLPQPSLRATLSREGQEKMIELTLTRMADGGIHDQIGGGFCRYSVDERWEIPHFEKMLYDNAQLLPLYAGRARASSDTRDRRIVSFIEQWLAREMTAPHGAFYAALDADSEGEEGKFYLWQRDEVRTLLDDAEFSVAARHFGLNRAPNFEGVAWNPIIAESNDAIAAALNLDVARVDTLIDSAREKLFIARSQRVRPGLDDKILTAWNALMISGLARAARALDSPSLATSAHRALESLLTHCWREEQLYASFDGRAARFPGYLDDHAFLLDALIEWLQFRWDSRHLAWAMQLADTLLERFEDRQRGGFWFTAHDAEKLPQRPKSFADEAIPSGNGIAARALLRLGHLIGETRYLDAAERALRAAFFTMQQMPHACPTLLRALNDFLDPRTHIVIRYHGQSEWHTWRNALTAASGDARRVDAYFIGDDAANLPATLAAQKYISGGVAYLCHGTQCLPPIADSALLVSQFQVDGMIRVAM